MFVAILLCCTHCFWIVIVNLLDVESVLTGAISASDKVKSAKGLPSLIHLTELL